MNFALSTIIIISCLLPGAVAIKAYYSSIRSKASNSKVSFNDLLINGIFLTFIIHSSAICIIKWWFKNTIQFDLLYSLLVGKNNDEFSIQNKSFTEDLLNFCLYITMCSSISFGIVKIIKYLVHKHELDKRWPILINSNHWFIIFNKEYAYVIKNIKKKERKKIDWQVVDVFVAPNIIYSGILVDFNYSPEKDELENIVLTIAKKRRVTDLTSFENKFDVGETVSIPGEFFVISMKNVLNINVNYISISVSNMDRNEVKNQTISK